MSRKVPRCATCPYLQDRGFGQYGRRLCMHPVYDNPCYRNGLNWGRKLIPSTNAATSPRWCPLRGGDR